MRLSFRCRLRPVLLWLTLAALLTLQFGAQIHRLAHTHGEPHSPAHVLQGPADGGGSGLIAHTDGTATCVALDALLLTPGFTAGGLPAAATHFHTESPRSAGLLLAVAAPLGRPRVRDPPVNLNV